MRWPSLAGGGKTVGFTPRQANLCSWNQRIGAFGLKNNWSIIPFVRRRALRQFGLFFSEQPLNSLALRSVRLAL